MLPRKPFYFLRHGQTEWNRIHRFQGQTDIPLNATGRAQARDAIAKLTDAPITQIFSSPLSRARETADIVNDALNLTITTHPGLQEVGFGVMEGQQKDLNEYTRNWRQGQTPAQAESFVDFSARVISTLTELLDHDGTPLFVAHGGVFWPVQDALGLVVNGNLPNATPLRVYPTDDGWDWSLL